MTLIGAELAEISAGCCVIRLPYRPDLTQQHGYFHAGVTSIIADSAGGYAAYSMMPADSEVLTVEYKMNLLKPADGEYLIARGEVVRAGRTLVVTRVDVDTVTDSRAVPCAALLQTLMCLRRTTGPKPEESRYG